MSDINCLQKISNISEECAYAYFNKKAILEEELALINEKKSVTLGIAGILAFFGLLITNIYYNKNLYTSLTVAAICILTVSYLSYRYLKYYSKSKALKDKLIMKNLKASVELTDSGINSILEQNDWNENELYIIARCLNSESFTYLDVIDIKDSVAVRYYHEEKLSEWNNGNKKTTNVTDISQIAKSRQIKAFERILRMKGYRIAV